MKGISGNCRFFQSEHEEHFINLYSATLVLAYLEEKKYEQSEKEFESDFRKYIEANFKRFLDDCFLSLHTIRGTTDKIP